MAFNEAMKIGKCNIHGPEKRFMGFSWVFHGIFKNLQLVVVLSVFPLKGGSSSVKFTLRVSHTLSVIFVYFVGEFY